MGFMLGASRARAVLEAHRRFTVDGMQACSITSGPVRPGANVVLAKAGTAAPSQSFLKAAVGSPHSWVTLLQHTCKLLASA